MYEHTCGIGWLGYGSLLTIDKANDDTETGGPTAAFFLPLSK